MEVHLEITKKKNSKITMNILSAIMEYCKKHKIATIISDDGIKVVK